ncbi:MAG: hypothetical protein U9Q20_07615 [Campylobacterota bacterium]|nr:hypothetical protein [Campylobacterota bacterium]
MCVIISGVFTYLAYSFYIDGNTLNAIINGTIAIFFLGLLTRNILKTKKEKDLK